MADVRRLSRGQSHDLVTRLENLGLTPEMAASVIDDRTDTMGRAMVAVAQFGAETSKPTPTCEMATRRRTMFLAWHKKIGLKKIRIPQLYVTDEEYQATLDERKEYFFVHLTSLEQYKVFMTAVGQSKHWTVNHKNCHMIGWQFTSTGYWIKAEVTPFCLHLNKSWFTLVTNIRLPSLEEYVIIWHFLKYTGTVIDLSTRCWLRTRFTYSGALSAKEKDGGVLVSSHNADDLSMPEDAYGGRSTGVVKN